jgi:hypothetical protein
MNCEPHDLIHCQEGGLRSRAAPHVSSMLAQSFHLQPSPSALRASTSHPLTTTGDRPTPVSVSQEFLAMPFDALRCHYAGAVMAGLVKRSIIASGNLERSLDALEKIILGPLARQR